jgi:hypothetical protein
MLGKQAKLSNSSHANSPIFISSNQGCAALHGRRSIMAIALINHIIKPARRLNEDEAAELRGSLAVSFDGIAVEPVDDARCDTFGVRWPR